MEPKKYGSFLERLAAYLFDYLLVGLLPLLFLFSAVNSVNSISQFWISGLWVLYEIIFCQWLVYWLYLIFTFILFKGSLGKILAGLRIEKENGQKVIFNDALIRFPIGYTISIALYYLGFLWMIKDKSKQTIHDHFAKTVVVKKEASWPIFMGLPILVVTAVFLIISIIRVGDKNGLWREVSLDLNVFSRNVNQLIEENNSQKNLPVPTPRVPVLKEKPTGVLNLPTP